MMRRSLLLPLLLALSAGLLPGQSGQPSTSSTVPTAPPSPETLARGEATFVGKGACLSCHQLKGHGLRVGSDLGDAGSKRTAADLERALLHPNNDAAPKNELYAVTMRDGTRHVGKLLNQDLLSLQLLDAQDRLLSLRRSDVLETKFIQPAPMPSYADKLSPDELHDLVAFLLTLR